MHRIILSFFLLSFVLTACSPKTHLANTDNDRKANVPTKFLADLNGSGEYTPLTLDEYPNPVQGEDRWIRSFYSNINYPASARENGISGRVVLDVFVDQLGQVTEVGIHKSLSEECDAEAKRAYLASITQGYTPLLIDGLPVAFNLRLPVGFWLE